jgi:exoribonuclease-2
MIESQVHNHHQILQAIAHRVMLERGLIPDFPLAALAELKQINAPAQRTNQTTRDLRNLIWCSIDNNDSEDLDQLTVAESLPDGDVKIMVAIADVDALVKQRMALDEHARVNTTSVYTAAQIFPMLPEKLSTDYTSLGYQDDRLAVVVEMVIGTDGMVKSSDIYSALVHNQAKLAYHSVAEWLDGQGPMPEAIGKIAHLEENLRLQDSTAQKMKTLRHLHGALDFETTEARPVFENNVLTDLETESTNRAKDIIADFMIASNGVVARYLTSHNFPSIRRVVRTPKRWNRIVELADEQNYKLPVEPDSKALNDFLIAAKAKDLMRFADLSLSVIKLLGPGEYVVEMPGANSAGHFGLAVRDYAHSTAPNRRFADLVTQRLIKAVLSKKVCPYTIAVLEGFASHCTLTTDAVHKVERQVEKAAAAMLLESRIGEQFDGIVTGASDKGTYVRVFRPPVEGRIVSGFAGLDVGQRVKVELVHTDAERGFIDFKKAE